MQLVLISFETYFLGTKLIVDQEAALVQRALELITHSILENPVCLKPSISPADSKSTINEVLLIQYLYSNLKLINKFAAHVDAEYNLKRHERMDPKRISLTPSILNEVTQDIHFCEQIRESSLAITELISSGVELFLEPHEKAFTAEAAYDKLRLGIRVQCRAQIRLASCLVERLESQLKFFGLYREMQESTSIRLLTLLASIFLPMSLATGILSMQARFATLHYLLYDFCGVVIIFGTIIIAVFLVLKLFMVLVDQSTKLRVRPGAWVRYEHLIIWPLIFAGLSIVVGFWAIVFTSFMVGMIKDTGLGLKILGYGCAAYAGIFLVSAALISAVFLVESV
jgi:hypothetical protein